MTCPATTDDATPDYTPTTEEVETHWADVGFASDRASFRRWLAEIERAAAEKALLDMADKIESYAVDDARRFTEHDVRDAGGVGLIREYAAAYRRNEGENDGQILDR